VKGIASDLKSLDRPKPKLAILLQKWGFRLPTATAILTVFYPDTFTIYDVRVCEELKEFQRLADQSNFEKLWAGYEKYVEGVRKASPAGLTLRDKDRYLWAKSFYVGSRRSLKAPIK
jgi:hypothetical protein